jgi:hypothetical protein
MFLALKQLRRTASWYLARVRDPRSIGFLAEALWFADATTISGVMRAMIEILPTLSADDGRHLTPVQRRCLYRILGERGTSFRQLQIALLGALEQIGDAGAVPMVEALTDASDPRVRAAASASLPLLRARVAGIEASETLLRASDGASSSGCLLRPSAGAAEAAPQSLLRATAGQDVPGQV